MLRCNVESGEKTCKNDLLLIIINDMFKDILIINTTLNLKQSCTQAPVKCKNVLSHDFKLHSDVMCKMEPF